MTDQNRGCILLVEDEALIALSGARKLEALGYRCLVAMSGEEALRLATEGSAVDLVLMDIDLGAGMDGTEAARGILALRDLPILFMSSHNERAMVEKVRGITRYGYLSKSSGDAVLESSIEMAFELFRAKSAAREGAELYRSLLDHMGNGFAYCRMEFEGEVPVDFTFLYVNQAFGPQSGLEAVVGRRVRELLPGIGERDRPMFELYGRVARTGRSEKAELYVSTLGIWVSLSVYSPRPGHFVAVFDNVTERKRDEEELREGRERLEVTLNSIGDAVIATDPAGRVTRMNPVAARLCGYAREEALGRPLGEVFRIVNALTGEEALDPVGRVLATGQIVGLANHTLLLSRDGARHQIADSAAPIRDSGGATIGVVLVFRDVTEEYAIRARLLESEERLRFALEASNDGVWDVDLRSGGLYLSPRGCEILGFSPEELPRIAAIWSELVHPEDLPLTNERLAAYLEGREPFFAVEQRLRTRSGAWKWILSRGMVVSRGPGGEPLRMVGTHSDIEARKEAEDQARRLYAERETLLRETRHRVKNNILAVESLIRMHIEAAGEGKALAVLQDSLGRLEGVRMLYERFAPAEGGLRVGEYLGPLVAGLVDLFPQGSGLELETRFEEGLVLESRLLFPLGMIVNELVTNALKYAFPRGRGRLSVRLSRQGDRAFLSVEDDGQGLPPGGASKGFGLGLVQELAEQLGGTFAIESAGGTRCRLFFPLAPGSGTFD